VISPNSESCSPPTAGSPVLAVGTPDANGAVANSQSKARYQLVSGDMQLHASLTDVRCRATNAACPDGPGSDYTGNLLSKTIVRATDRYNGNPATESATTVDFPLQLPMPCTGTTGTEGSNCGITSSLNSLIPGATVVGNRTIYELGQVEVLDAGPNGTGYGAGCPTTCGDGDESVFMRQGIFIP
jgi:hypothetical protein